MNQFAVSVLETKKYFSSTFGTHPLECGWAKEGIFFVRVEDIKGNNAVLVPHVQISMDGVNWVDEGTTIPEIGENGTYFCKVSHFGGWLRLLCHVEGQKAEFKVTIQLVLKE